MICNSGLEQRNGNPRREDILTLIAGIGTGPTDRIGDWDIRSPEVVVDLLSVWGKSASKKCFELCKHSHQYGCNDRGVYRLAIRLVYLKLCIIRYKNLVATTEFDHAE